MTDAPTRMRESPQEDVLRHPLWQVAVVVVVLLAALFALSLADGGGSEATLLFVLPIALLAIERGVWGGLVAGLLSLALVFAWDLSQPDADLDAIDYLLRAVAFLALGGLVGRFVTAHRALEQKIARSEELSLDLMATASFGGYFTRLNRAWERALGWTIEELCAHPIVSFVHPEDRQRTLAEIALVAGGRDSITFRNRYRTRDGSFRWLEWNACVDTEQAVIHANARDITVVQQAEDAVRRHGLDLEQTVRERTSELEQARLETLQRLALAAEFRDDDTHQHTERVGHACMLISRAIGLPEDTVQTLRDAAPLHDIGKLGVSDSIMLKPGKLTAPEFQTMKQHTVIGAAILANSTSCVLRMAEEIALTHHERWDGSGYPDGIAGEEIPVTARITALADAFDAMSHTRPYKEAWPISAVLREIRRSSGTHFDPMIVQAFLTLDHASLVESAETRSDRPLAAR